MENMKIYEAGRSVPQEAQRPFDNGRFKGTDINPMWRIKKLTEIFGPAGFGWYYKVLSERSEAVGDTVMAIVDLELYVKDGDNWSQPIYGTGGNTLLNKGRASDEGYKMALTDALSVACKALGIGADIYFQADRTKYTDNGVQKAADPSGSASRQSNPPYAGREGQGGRPQLPRGGGGPGSQTQIQQPPADGDLICSDCGSGITPNVANWSRQKYGRCLCYSCQKKAGTA